MSSNTDAGTVWLVGAGPGDPGLITVAGLSALQAAEVVVYDRLVHPRLLSYARPDAEIIYVGKAPRGHTLSQEEINDLLVAKARQGRQVVRLKGGDPYVFGRGGEEAEVLRAAGVPFVVVPGVTAAVAVPAYAGIPITHRRYASSFAVVTGHEDAAKDDSSIEWQRLATAVDTIVLLMGSRTLPDVAKKLIAHGRSPQTPAAVIQWGTTPQQRTVTGTLADIARRAAAAGLTSPAVTVVGDVVSLRDALNWYEARPLFGKQVLVTRTRQQASHLVDLLLREGAEPVELPTIEIKVQYDAQEMEKAIRRLEQGDYDWLIFTSANAVDIFFEALWKICLDARAIGSTGVAAIGPATSDALKRWGIYTDVVADRYTAEGLVAAFKEQFDVRGQRILIPRAEGARDVLVKGLTTQGATVEELPLYVAVPPTEAPAEALAMLRDGKIDVVTFTSSSTVRHLVGMLDGDMACLERPLIACIGPVTAETARALGLRVDVVAQEHTVPGLVRAIREKLSV